MSAAPLVRKLGIRRAARVCFVDAPPAYDALLGPLPPDVVVEPRPATGCDFIQLFATRRTALKAMLPRLKGCLAPNGMLWLSWPKRTSKIDTDLTRDIVRLDGLEAGLVDVKVCAVDRDWSALKFVYRLSDRPHRSG